MSKSDKYMLRESYTDLRKELFGSLEYPDPRVLIREELK